MLILLSSKKCRLVILGAAMQDNGSGDKSQHLVGDTKSLSTQ